MTGPLYRAAGPFDTALLAELHRQCFTHRWDQPWSEKSFGDVLAMPGAACLISVAAEAPIAFGLTLQAADEVELLLLGTLPAARGQGAGRALLDRLLVDAASRGARRAFLEVAEGNAAAIRCYIASGFAPCGRRKSYYPGKIDALMFSKDLNAG